MINCILNNLEMENQLAPLATLSVLRKHRFAGFFFHPDEYGSNAVVVYGVFILGGAGSRCSRGACSFHHPDSCDAGTIIMPGGML